MFVHFGTELLQPEWKQAIVCIGTFDGVHVGHRAVIATAVEKARQAEMPAVLVTFDQHPAAILNPDRCPKAIGSISNNIREIEQLGIAVAVVLPFNAWLSRMSAERFLREILMGNLRAHELVVGHDFAMGNGREGDTNWLQARIETTVVDPYCMDGERVSSSHIRHAIESGEICTANRMLGRPFRIGGVVVHGLKLGRTLGYPTINVAQTFKQVLPADGIYAAKAEFDGVEYMAALSVGLRPAVKGTQRTVEAYLLDFPGHSLYGRAAQIDVLERIREERDFPSLDALTKQISRDVQEVRERLTRK